MAEKQDGLAFQWNHISATGHLMSPDELIHWPGYNFVAVPEERLEEVRHVLAEVEGECVL